MKEEGSLSGYDGPLYLDEIVVDIDAPALAPAYDCLMDVVNLLRANEVPDEAIRVWTTGGTGYHVHLPTGLCETEQGHPDYDEQLLTWMYALFGTMIGAKDADPAHVDVSMLDYSSPVGLIRAKWSAHEDTGRFKVPIRPAELADGAEAHAEWSRAPRRYRQGVTHEPLDSHVEPLRPERQARGETSQPRPNAHTERPDGPQTDADFDGDSETETSDKTPQGVKPEYVTCMWHLSKRGPVDGRRHNDMERLAAAHAYRGLSQNEIQAALIDWLDAPEKGLPIDSAGRQDVKDMSLRATGQHPNGDGERWSRFRCDDEVMTEFCDSDCLFYKYREEENPVATSGDRTRALIEYLTMDADDGINIGHAFGADQDCLVQPSEVVTFYGNTGLGKTALMQHIALANDHLRILDVTMEMSIGAQETRYLQIKEGLRRNPNEDLDEVKDLLMEIGQEAMHERRTAASSHISVMTTAPYLSHLERHVREEQADVLIIDPVGKVRVEGQDDKHAIRTVYRELTDLARRLDLIILCIRHIRKSGMSEYLPTLADVKGYKEVSEESEFVFGFGGTRDSTMRQLKLMKANRPVDFNIYLQGDPETFRFVAGKTSPNGTTDSDNGSDNIDTDAVISNSNSLPS